MVMPWGKFKGCALEHVPLTYLAWCLETAALRDPALVAALRREVLGRLRVLDALPPTRLSGECGTSPNA